VSKYYTFAAGTGSKMI